MWTINIADNGMVVGVSFIGQNITHYKRKNSSWTSASSIKISEEAARLLIKKFNFEK